MITYGDPFNYVKVGGQRYSIISFMNLVMSGGLIRSPIKTGLICGYWEGIDTYSETLFFQRVDR